MAGENPPKERAVYLREIARLIEPALLKVDKHNLHWVAVVDEASVQPMPVRQWTQTHADSVLQVAVTEGNSEGMLLYVHAMHDRYKPGQVEALWRIKLLCGHDQAFEAARDLSRFLGSEDFAEITNRLTREPTIEASQ